jgi:DNA-binding MarR family transcriptional regulator
MSVGIDPIVLQLRRIADRLEAGKIDERQSPTQPNDLSLESANSQFVDRPRLARFARRLLVELDFRTRLFTKSFIGEPAWRLMLELYASTVEGKTITVTAACQATRIPSTTALRLLKLLEDEEIIARNPHPVDGRQSNIELTSRATVNIELCLSQMIEPPKSGRPFREGLDPVFL